MHAIDFPVACEFLLESPQFFGLYAVACFFKDRRRLVVVPGDAFDRSGWNVRFRNPLYSVIVKAKFVESFSREVGIWNRVSKICCRLSFRSCPDSEEAQDVVDAECVIVLCAGLDSVFPPCVLVCLDPVPVVCRKSPVLTHRISAVRWRTCAQILAEELRPCPAVDAVFVHEDRYVSLEYDLLCAETFCAFLELLGCPKLAPDKKVVT